MLVVNILYSDIAGRSEACSGECVFVIDAVNIVSVEGQDIVVSVLFIKVIVNTVRKQQKQINFLKKYFMGMILLFLVYICSISPSFSGFIRAGLKMNMLTCYMVYIIISLDDIV